MKLICYKLLEKKATNLLVEYPCRPMSNLSDLTFAAVAVYKMADTQFYLYQ